MTETKEMKTKVAKTKVVKKTSNSKKQKKKGGFRLTHYFFIVIIILMLVLGVVVYRFVFPSYTQEDLYGRRVENLYEIQEIDLTKLKSFISTPEFVDKVTVDVRGAVVYIMAEVKDVDLDTLKQAYPIKFADTEINLKLLQSYDINATFINPTEVEDEDGKKYFPIAFYHNKEGDLVKWQAKHAWQWNDPDAEEEEENSEDNTDTEE